MAIDLTTDPHEFQARAWPFLEREMVTNVMASVLLGVLRGRYDECVPVFAYELDANGQVVAAALRTPPLALLVSEFAPDSVDALLDAWLGADPDLPGVNGPPRTAHALAAAFTERTGQSAHQRRGVAMHALREVSDPPRPPAGALRRAELAEAGLLREWWLAFGAEAGSPLATRSVPLVGARIEAGELFVWDDAGPTSMVGISPAVAGVVRIGPVYTPPEYRRHGYAGMAVAEVSRLALAGPASTCMLFTDLANPTSNKIYAEVGYRRCGDWEELAFEG
jgi:predicted GNAT family acetyltransferase